MEEQTMPSTAPKNTGLIIGLVIALVVIGAVIIFFSMRSNSNTDSVSSNEANSVSPETTNVETPATTNVEVTTTEGSVNVSVPPVVNEEETEPITAITVTGNNFAFDPKEIKVKEGDKVSITFMNTEGTHDFLIDEFSVNTGVLKAGTKKTVNFTANKKGSFQYYCSVGQHRAMGMWGTLIVE